MGRRLFILDLQLIEIYRFSLNFSFVSLIPIFELEGMNKFKKMNQESTPPFGAVNFERRKHPRLSINLPVEYWQINNSISHPGHTADISEGGLFLHLPEEIEIGQNLRIKLFFDSGLKLKTIEAMVQAVWKDFRLEKESYYRLGVKFVDISAEALEELKNFLIILNYSKIPSDFNVPPKLPSTLGISIFGDCAYQKPKSPEKN